MSKTQVVLCTYKVGAARRQRPSNRTHPCARTTADDSEKREVFGVHFDGHANSRLHQVLGGLSPCNLTLQTRWTLGRPDQCTLGCPGHWTLDAQSNGPWDAQTNELWDAKTRHARDPGRAQQSHSFRHTKAPRRVQ